MSSNLELTSDIWHAIVSNDTSYDEQFLYGVSSTRIYCRPSCKSRAPKRENVRLFLHANEAEEEGFRPCKRCKPNGLGLPNEEWIEQMVSYIENHYFEKISLQLLADSFHGSSYHLQRTFKKVKNITPLEYLQNIRIEKAIYYMKTTNLSVKEIGEKVGFQSIPYFITLFKKKMGMTPKNYAHVIKVEGKEYETRK